MGNRAHRARRAAAARAVVLQQPGNLANPLVAVYQCHQCGHQVRTAVVDDGTVPMTLGCRATPGCTGTSTRTSMGKPEPGSRAPGWQWYAPDAATMARLRAADGPLWDHIAAGGLLIRRTTR